MQHPDELEKFLRAASGQQEAALVIAKNEEAFQKVRRTLEEDSFTKAEGVTELLARIDGGGKIYFALSDTMDKDTYDFLVQYPTGQVEIFDRSKMQSHVAVPDYGNLSIAVLITTKNLAALEAQGFDLRGHTGIAYQA